MDLELRQQMLAYFEEQASEYEDAYTFGTGTSSIRDAEVFKLRLASWPASRAGSYAVG
jgi:hypothetical protein